MLYLPIRLFDPICIQPKIPIGKFVYHCGRKFLDDCLYEATKIAKRKFGVVRIFGEETEIFVATEFGDMTKVDNQTARLQKRQDRGGQSQNRIARLRLEKIHNYLKIVGEKIMAAFTDNGLSTVEALLIAGPGLKKEQLVEYINLGPTPIFVRPIATPADPITPLLFQMVEELNHSEAKGELDVVIELMATNPDLLVFGDEVAAAGDGVRQVFRGADVVARFGSPVGVLHRAVAQYE